MKEPMEILREAYRQGVFSDLELAFVRFISRVEPDAGEGLLVAAALAVRATRQGNVCVDLGQVAGVELFVDGDDCGQTLPELVPWLAELQKSTVVGDGNAFRPLVLDGANRIYLQRYWQYEQDLAQGLRERGQGLVEVESQRLSQVLSHLFPEVEENVVDCQRLAAAAAAMRNLCIISGGPGTGKTFTVVKLLALLQELAAPETLRIGLVAPTGKAAGRLQESIRAAKGQLDLSAEILARIPEDSATIHRLLGARFGSPYFRHNRHNPLPLDVLVVDEASMVDLALIAKLVDALPKTARLVLLGDKDQLASVEAGSVLGDICSGKEVNEFSGEFVAKLAEAGFAGVSVGAGGLGDSIVLLEKSYRFDTAGSIGKLAQAVNRGDGEAAVTVLRDDDHEDLALHAWQSEGSLSRLKDTVRTGFLTYLEAETPEVALPAFNRFRILCAHRRGRFGVEGMNDWVEGVLAEAGLISRDSYWYRSRPVMITRNPPVLHLYNGDIGITMPDDTGRLRVFFAGADGSLRSFAPARIPEHETAFAVTVHKSQGSEFESVALLLPERVSPVLSRELVYTAITRARKRFALWGEEDVLREAVTRRVSRASGLRALLWE